MKQANILYISDLMLSGGVSTFHQSLLRNKGEDDQRLECNFFDLNRKGQQKNLANRQLLYPLPRFWRRGILLFRILTFLFAARKICSYKVILVDLVYNGLALHIVKILRPSLFRSVRIVYQFHGYDYRERQSILDFENKKNILTQLSMWMRCSGEIWMLRQCFQIIVFSEYAKKQLVEKEINPNSIFKLKPGIPYGIVPSNKKVRQNQTVLYPSRLEPRKGLFPLLELWNEKLTLLSGVKLILATHLYSDYDVHHLLGLIDKYELNDIVELRHSVSRQELQRLYQEAAVTVVPSLDLETFGFVTLESFTQGTPVVAYDIGANSELIPRSCLADLDQPESLVEKISEILTMPTPAYQKLSDQVLLISENYSWEAYVKYLKDLAN